MTKRAQGLRPSRRLVAVVPALAAGALLLAACGNGEVATPSGPGSEAEPGIGELPPVFTPSPEPGGEQSADRDDEPGDGEGVVTETVAEAALADASGTSVGTATFLPDGESMKITVEVDGLAQGSHTVLLTDSGVCEAADGFASAGDALVLDGTTVGELSTLTVDETGEGSLTTDTATVVTRSELTEGQGTALVVADGDERVACGVVELV